MTISFTGQPVANGILTSRKNAQAERIQYGLENNTLTEQEIDKLDQLRDRINSRHYSATQDGEGMNVKEFAKLNRGLNRMSNVIFRANHDLWGADASTGSSEASTDVTPSSELDMEV